MGNNPSRPRAPSPSSTTSPASAASTTPTRREPRRRESIQTLPSGKATAAPPSASLESATAHSTSQHRLPSTHSRPRSRTIESAQPTEQAGDVKMGNEQSQQQDSTEPVIIKPSRPVNVPTASDGGVKQERSPIEPSAPPSDLHHIPPSQTQRPPRLPLPIGEEVLSPGSPIISPADVASALDHDSIAGVIPRRNSVLSSTTIDDDELGDEDHAYTVEGEVRKTIPTVIEWKQGGDKVYVTGTFAGWNKKYRLHRLTSKDALSASIALPPGTHHVKFLVDGEMRTSDHLPTAVDYANILVNYLEVNADDIPPPSKPVDIAPRRERAQHPPPGVFPPQILPPTPDTHPTSPTPPTGPSPAPTSPEPPKLYSTTIPPCLLDIDMGEDTPAYQRAAPCVSSLPQPPSLPLFLGKSILNGSTPMKDDASVLTMPNHTVLNHLATSSIKNGVLATSGTTRFKRKYITTILYKPTSEDRD
ncbi:MAG: hypothetical protein M1833_005422 [Piccolia ochrophora]|nr:MAG: hypothetical protein M1833_005422 [Piccolia ochrophora]